MGLTGHEPLQITDTEEIHVPIRKSIVALLAFILLAPATPTRADNVFEIWKAAMTIEVQTIAIAGTGKHGGTGSLTVNSTAMSGPVSFRAGSTLVSGLMLKGKFKTGGASLGAIF